MRHFGVVINPKMVAIRNFFNRPDEQQREVMSMDVVVHPINITTTSIQNISINKII
jgi:hypothetical protein